MSFWSRISNSIGVAKPGEPAAAQGPAALVEAPQDVAENAEASRLVKERLDLLFRYGTRQGTINPLLYVVTRYRAQEPK